MKCFALLLFFQLHYTFVLLNDMCILVKVISSIIRETQEILELLSFTEPECCLIRLL